MTDKQPSQLVWEAYVDAMDTYYGYAPKLDINQLHFARRIAERVGAEDGVAVVRYYVSKRKPFYLQRCHPLDLLFTDLEFLSKEMRERARK